MAPRHLQITSYETPITSAYRLGLAIVLLVYLGVGALYAVNTPAWQVPDEPAHYNYLRYLVDHRALPVLHTGDYDYDYLERLKAEHFPPELSVEAIRYEGWQPPLYYLLAAPIFAATGGSLLALRLFSLLLGGLVILLTWKLARTVAPRSPLLALTAAGFAAFVPQHVAMMAGVDNDALAEVVMGLGLWLAAAALMSETGQRARRTWAMGVVLGLAFLTKLSVYPLAALFGLALLLLARRERWAQRRLLLAALELYAPALLLGGLWWGRNLSVYGGFDFLGTMRHDAIVVGQPRTSEMLAVWGAAGYLQRYAAITFQSFWGQFGWMGVLMDQRVYLVLQVYSALLAIGAAGVAWEQRRAGLRLPRSQADVAVLLTVTVLLVIAVYLYYNLTFVQFQGRYLYPALPVLALGAALSLRQWSCWLLALGRRVSAPVADAARVALPLAAVALMALLDLFALYRFVIPALAG